MTEKKKPKKNKTKQNIVIFKSEQQSGSLKFNNLIPLIDIIIYAIHIY